jgi:hypothetical protein
VLTPLTKNREPDISFVIRTGQMIAPHLAKGTLVVLESTTYPGTTDEDLRHSLEEGSRMEAGVDFHLAFYQNVKIPLMKDDPGKEELSTSVGGVLLRGKTAPPYGDAKNPGDLTRTIRTYLANDSYEIGAASASFANLDNGGGRFWMGFVASACEINCQNRKI